MIRPRVGPRVRSLVRALMNPIPRAFVAVFTVVCVFACVGGASAQSNGAIEEVEIVTSLGTIRAEIYVEKAPVTANNFLRYVEDRLFDGGSFFRSVRLDNQPNDSVRIEVIQGGTPPEVRDLLRPAIPLERTNETGLRHVDGALSMARGGPDTGRSQFFICVGDQPSLDFGGNRNLDGQGFAVFGRVVEGMEVVRLIQNGEVEAQRLLEPVAIERIRRASGPEARLEVRLQAHLDSLVEHSQMPGLTFGLSGPDGVSIGLAAGVADTLSGRLMRADDRMLQGSVGKTYFGAVALQLVAEGRLDLDEDLETYLGDAPWYADLPNGHDVTIRQILSHTSGIVRYELNPRFLEDLAAEPFRTFTPEDRLSYLAGTPPPFAAGEGWEYSDTNFILLAMVIEAITGKTAYGEIHRRLLDPLGLDDTVASDRPTVDGIANGYAGPDNPFGAFDATVVNGRLAFNPQFEWGGGGFASSAQDLAEWTRHVQEGRAFDPALLEPFRSGTPAALGPEASYGLGVIMMELPTGTAWGHSGFMPGYRTEAYYFPEHGFSLALQVNTTDSAALGTSPLRLLDGLAAVVAADYGSGSR